RRAIEWITAIGLALNCRVTPVSVFHRKNYFYADLPKNYQISQYDIPVCHDGWLEVEVDGELVWVGIERAHMEEDTGKSLHVGAGGRIHAARATLLDFNRSGVPLVEIVSRPDLRTPEQARAYAQQLRALVAALGVSDTRLEEGSIRFDANVSVRPQGDQALGVKVEIKNMNSFRSLERALAYEIERQVEALEAGGEVVQETRHWDEQAGVTHGMRTKEGSSDYRYFTEPDLVPMAVDEAWLERVGAGLPELPGRRKARYLELGLDPHAAGVLVSADDRLRDLFEEALGAGSEPRAAANWVTGEVTAYLRREDVSLDDTPLTGPHLAQLTGMVAAGTLSASAAREVLAGVLAGEGTPQEVAAARDLIQVSDASVLEQEVEAVLAAHPDEVGRIRAGEQKLVGFLVGQVMRATGGKADPRTVNELLRVRLGG
ncbi:MAG: Asp-tRNA(Asn)/Glu-tRNA(Gln) amidotransferase subunit GatB, partial [Acidimicrobiia bacterium]